MIPTRLIAGCALLLGWTALAAKDVDDITTAVAQLRHAHGQWQVTTEFLKPDGSVDRSVEGSYRFEWVVPDRVLSGRSDLPELERTSAILFYLREASGEIEMVSVGADGRLWVMTGPAGGETRTTPPFENSAGGQSRLRFTRFNVEPDRFESRMEYSSDGGTTWLPGNHQVFTRQQP